MRSEVHEHIAYVYAITNRHVVDDGCFFIRVNRKDDQTPDVIATNTDRWLRLENDDLAIASVSIDEKTQKVRTIPIVNLMTEAGLAEMSIGPGDDVFMVGRFVGYDGIQRNQPSVRFGNISMMPYPMFHPSNKSGKQDSFLVEMRSICGYSGSPVFVTLPPMEWYVRQNLDRTFWDPANPYKPGPYLLGVDWGATALREEVRGADSKPLQGQFAGWHLRTPSGITNVVPAWKLRSILEGEFVTSKRKEWDEKIPRRVAEPIVETHVAAEEFTKDDFEKLLKKVSRKLPEQSQSEGPSESDPKKP